MKIIKKVLLSSDALFDLRQGTLTRINSEFAVDVTTDKSYFIRNQDLFSCKKYGTLDKELYSKIYSAYKDEIIRSSIMTAILPFTHSLCGEYIRQAINGPVISGVELEVNLYPFEFTQAECEELLTTLVQTLGVLYPIALVSISPQELTVDLVRKDYSAIISYDYAEWFNLHTDELKKNPLHETGFYVPKIYFQKVPSDEELAEFKKHKTTPFDFMTQALAPFAVIQHLPIAMYCADTPLNLEAYRAITK